MIELLVVIAILAALMAIAVPAIYGQLGAGDEAKCRANLEQLLQMGTRYGQDMAHKTLLPTSGMDDDEDTENVNESEGWWLSLAPLVGKGTYVLPRKPGDPMKVSAIFHCPADHRKEIGSDSTFEATVRSVSYVTWTDASEDPDNVNSCIRTSARQNLDMLPWLSDGNPVKGKSVTDADTFKKMVMAAAERHGGKVMVAYASGVIKAVEVNPRGEAKEQFAKIAPELAKRRTRVSDEYDDESDDEEEE